MRLLFVYQHVDSCHPSKWQAFNFYLIKINRNVNNSVKQILTVNLTRCPFCLEFVWLVNQNGSTSLCWYSLWLEEALSLGKLWWYRCDIKCCTEKQSKVKPWYYYVHILKLSIIILYDKCLLNNVLCLLVKKQESAAGASRRTSIFSSYWAFRLLLAYCTNGGIKV
jgi:hypothetical protein